MIAGAGYVIDNYIALAMAESALWLAPFLFAGEMAFMVWLLAAAGRPGRA